MHKVLGALSLAFLFTTQFAFAECRPGMPCFNGSGRRVIMGGPVFRGGGCQPGMSCNQGGGFNSPFNGGINGGVNGPSSFIPGQGGVVNGGTDPRFVSTGDPARVVTIVNQFNQRVRGEARDNFNNVIATTNQFDQFGRPFFDTATTGLSSDGFRRVASVTPSATGQVPTGTILPDASLQQVNLTDGSKGWAQVRPGFQPQTIAVVTGPGVVFQQNGNQLTQVQGAAGDLVTRDAQGRLILVDKAVGQELMKKYQGMTSEDRARVDGARPGSTGLIDSVVSRQAQFAGTGGGSTTPQPPNTGGSHTTPGSNTPVRPIDGSTAPSAWTEYKEKFEKGEVPDSESVGKFVKLWGDPDTIKDGRPTAPLKMKCVSNADKNKKNPMTLFLSRTKNPAKEGEWLTNVRLDEGEVDISKAEIEKNRDRESLLLPNEANKSWNASRRFFPTKVDYDLRTIKVDGKIKFWMKVTSSLDTGKLDYLCGESEPARKEPNTDGTTPPAQPPTEPVKDKPTEQPPTQPKLDGKALFAAKCSVCHNADGEGDISTAAEGLKKVENKSMPKKSVPVTDQERAAIAEYLKGIAANEGPPSR